MKLVMVFVGLVLGLVGCTKDIDVPSFMRVKPHGKTTIALEAAGPKPRIFPKVKK